MDVVGESELQTAFNTMIAGRPVAKEEPCGRQTVPACRTRQSAAWIEVREHLERGACPAENLGEPASGSSKRGDGSSSAS